MGDNDNKLPMNLRQMTEQQRSGLPLRYIARCRDCAWQASGEKAAEWAGIHSNRSAGVRHTVDVELLGVE